MRPKQRDRAKHGKQSGDLALRTLQEARRLRAAGSFREAAAQYKMAARMTPRGQAGLFAALSLRDAGDLGAAEAAFRAYVQSHPDDVDGWSSLGTFLKRAGRYNDAIAPLRKALQLRDDKAVRNALISSLWRTGQLDEARREGLINLQLKDRLSRQNFQCSRFAHLQLRPGGRGFDPERPTRNIIAFSLWGDRPEYITGAIVNAQIAQHIYVRWTARFYCDPSVPRDALTALRAYGAQVVMMNRPEHQRIRPMWRFLASDDPEVNVFICRDADSRLNARELLAVTDWLQSGKRFQLMRDHIYHHELILAGMWGGMSGVLPNIAELLSQAPEYFDNRFGDQAFLGDIIWPLISSDLRSYDSCYRFAGATDFPPGYELPGQIHVGGSTKRMPHWSAYVQMPGAKNS